MNFHLGADMENSKPSRGLPDDAKAVFACLEQRPSFLMVGTLEPRKGHAQTLAAFEILWQAGNDINLVIIGKEGWLVDALLERLRTHPELNKRLLWLEGISDEYLEKIYAACDCLIASSEGKGFGLPLIEAAQHKLPIIARDIPVFREVAGDHAYYFNGLEPQDLADTVRQWLALHAEGKAPSSTNMPWLTWRQSTEQLLAQIV
jgi:glycosyltransferase involved in cell wall biosynthesis